MIVRGKIELGGIRIVAGLKFAGVCVSRLTVRLWVISSRDLAKMGWGFEKGKMFLGSDLVGIRLRGLCWPCVISVRECS